MAVGLFACTRRRGNEEDVPFEVHEIDDGAGGSDSLRSVVLLPRWARPEESLPILVALPGRSEALRGREASARAWLRDYEIARAAARLRKPPLTPADFHAHVEPSRLEAINRSLAERPFRGLVVVCPSIPEALAKRPDADSAEAFGKRVLDFLPRVRAMAPSSPAQRSVGIDGVSLGGRLALDAGLAHARSFAAIGTLQPALRQHEEDALVQRIRQAIATNPRLRLRLVTSRDDDFRDEVTSLHRALTEAGLSHDYEFIEGPHGYAFNRGPGAIEMLLWHDRVLRGERGL